MKQKLILILLYSLACACLPAQNPYLEDYIRQGLESNTGLRQKQLDYNGDLAALKEAKGLFFPDISLNARYTVADGGRIIEFPVGDLLNPVYSTLNMLTASEMFPQIENETFPFYRPTEQETKVSLVQPIFNSDLIQNYRIRKQQAEITRIDVERYKRELIREITQAYYAYKKAHNLVLLSDTSLSLVAENLRVSKSLFENDKVTIDAVYRSESELSKVEVQRAQAKNIKEASRAYFNFLLNRSLDASIELMTESPLPPVVSLEEATLLALQNRDELHQIEQYMELNKHLRALHRGKNIPGLFGVVDYGFQGEQYRFTNEDDFMLASLVMRWNLFQGVTNHQKVQQSRIDGEKLDELYLETQQQISMELIDHFYGLQAAYESVESANQQIRSARRAYELIKRKYMEGQSSLLELIDARTSMTGAGANVIIARSEYYSRLAGFECAMGANRPEKSGKYENTE
ncbi:MAG: TolC family protein [Bacteroidales bacterium]|nr:TolC family protein [Bacteroidales bacterium]